MSSDASCGVGQKTTGICDAEETTKLAPDPSGYRLTEEVAREPPPSPAIFGTALSDTARTAPDMLLEATRLVKKTNSFLGDAAQAEQGQNIEKGLEENRETPLDNTGDWAGRTRTKAPFITGWRLHFLTLGLCTGLLLSTLETTIVSTSLVSISNALNDFDKSGWVVTSYLLTYTGFLVIYAKFSDIFGRKAMMLLGLTMFTAFSVACGCAQTMEQLIVFRALQGIGGSGIYSMVSVIAPEMVPLDKYSLYMGLISSVFAITSVLGPILGGVINDHTTWRWVFFLNAPGGALALALIVFFLPKNFPYTTSDLDGWVGNKMLVSRERFRRLDWPGTAFSLVASTLLAFALQEAETDYPWRSPAIIVPLALSGLFGLVFTAWERRMEGRSEPEAIIPWRLLSRRMSGGVMLVGFLTGFPLMSTIINLPQRFQTVNGASPSEAGFRTLPFLLCPPVAAAVSGLMIAKLHVPPYYVLMVAGALQVVGVGLFSSLPDNRLSVSPVQYGDQVITGFGFGLGASTLLLMVRLVVDEKDLAVAMGSITYMKMLGGTIGLAICSSVLNHKMRTRLHEFLTPVVAEEVLKSTEAYALLTADQIKRVRFAYAEGFKLEMVAMAVITGVSLLALGLLWERPPRRMPEPAEVEQIQRR